MAIDLDYYLKINNAYNVDSLKDVELYNIKQNINSDFENNVDFERVLINGEEQGVLVIKSNTSTNVNIKKIISKPNETFKIGDIVEWTGFNWLITEIDVDRKIYTVGRIALCQSVLKWQNNKGDIIERPFVAKSASGGISEGDIMTVKDQEHRIQIPLDDETKALFNGKRFLIGSINNPSAYKIIKKDVITGNYGEMGGILNLTLEETELSEKDNKKLMIADYFEPSTPPSPVGNCEIVYRGQPVIRIGGSTKTFTAVFKDDDGNALDIQPVWSIDNTFDGKITTKIIDNSIKIKAVDDSSLIGETIVLILSDSDNRYNAEIKINIEGLW